METTIDTYAFITKLKEAGMPEPQAVVMSDTIKQVEQSRPDVLAAKADIYQVKTELKADIQQVRAEIQQVKTELSGQIMLLKWMLGFVLAGIVSIIFKLFLTP
jgi:hypothetical protein